MVKIVDNSTRFDFKMVDIAALFGITLNSELDERSQAVLVLAPVAALLRDMILKHNPVPESLWSILLTLSEHIEEITYPDFHGAESE